MCETSVVSLQREPLSENLPSAIDEMVVELRSFSSRHVKLFPLQSLFEERGRGLLLVTLRLSKRIRSQKKMRPNELLPKTSFSRVHET